MKLATFLFVLTLTSAAHAGQWKQIASGTGRAALPDPTHSAHRQAGDAHDVQWRALKAQCEAQHGRASGYYTRNECADRSGWKSCTVASEVVCTY
jgi:hypothetical protein